jgi:cell division septation protein DedD
VVTAGGDWFVNFSSYSQRGTAESWASKLKPATGNVVVAPAQSNGRDIFRVRVIDLADKSSAQAVANQLQREFSTGKLWVGRAD